MTVQTGLINKIPPAVPKKDKIKPEKFQKMKLSAARNAVEVHRAGFVLKNVINFRKILKNFGKK